MDEVYMPAGPDTVCDRAAIMIQIAANVDATSTPEAKELLLKAMVAILKSITPIDLVKDGNVVRFQ